MSGVDDLICELGSKELLRRLEEPFVILSDGQKSTLDLIQQNNLEIEKAIATLDKEQIEKTIEHYGRKKSFSVTKMRIVQNMWKNTIPPTKRTLEIVTDLYNDTMKKRSLALMNLISSIDDNFRNSNERSFLIIEKDNGLKPRILTLPKECSEFFSNQISYRTLIKDKETEELVPGKHQAIPHNLMAIAMQDKVNFSELNKVTYFSSFPIFSNGLLLSVPGYYKEEEFFYSGEEIIPRKENLKYLNILLDSFPFETPVDSLNVIGFLLGMFDRNKLIGEYPMIAIKGDTQSVGKTMLMDCLSILVEGNEATYLNLADEEEIKKSVVTHLMTSNFIVFDNIKGRSNKDIISSPFLEAAATSKIFEARILGGNTKFSRPNTFVIGFTLNGGVFSHDLLVRQVMISLHSSQSHKINHDFDPIQFCHENRYKIISGLAYLRSNNEK